MARRTIEHTCGHTQDHHLYGPDRERDRKLDWLRGTVCSECWKKQKAEQQQQQNVQAQQWAGEHHLPPLVGSQKQCEWAESIRREKLTGMVSSLKVILESLPDGLEARAFLTEIAAVERLGECAVFADWLEETETNLSSLVTHNAGDAETPGLLRAFAWLTDQAEAKWWIDTRYDRWQAQVQRFAEEPARLAREAAERARKDEQEAFRKALIQQQAAREAEAAVAAKAAMEERQRNWLRRLGELIGHNPADLVLLRFNSRQYGWRVIVNEGSDRYARDHLVDFYPKAGTIKTCRPLVGKKKELTAFCIEFWALNPEQTTAFEGKALFAEVDS